MCLLEFSEFLKLLLENCPKRIFLTFVGPLAHQNLQNLYIPRRIDSSSMNQKNISGWSWYLHTRCIFLKLYGEVMGDLYYSEFGKVLWLLHPSNIKISWNFKVKFFLFALFVLGAVLRSCVSGAIACSKFLN